MENTSIIECFAAVADSFRSENFGSINIPSAASLKTAGKWALYVGSAYYTGKTVKWYITKHLELARQQWTYEFVPPEDDGNIVYLHYRNLCRIKYAEVRWFFLTWGGLRALNSMQLSSLLEPSIKRITGLRPNFMPAGEKIQIFPCNSIHSHPQSAQFRSSTNNFLIELVRKAGYDPYVISKSTRDDTPGSRLIYHYKDVGIGYANDKITDRTAFILVDVDYYANMPRWLALGKPIVMYTLIIRQLHFSCREYSYRVRGDVVFYDVAGGAHYEHELWDYRGDTIVVIADNGDLIVYDVEQRQVQGDINHRIIALLPKARITDLLWLMLQANSQELTLKRKKIQCGNHLRLWEPIDDTLSVGRVGSDYSVTIKGRLYKAIETRLRNKDSKVYIGDVERMLKKAGIEDYAETAPILFDCFEEELKMTENMVKTTQFPTTFHPVGKEFNSTEDPKTPGQQVTTPLTSSPALTAAKGENADISTKEGRVNASKNTTKFSKEMKRHAYEFVRRVIPDNVAGKGVPISTAEVRAQQTKAQQIGRFNLVADVMSIEPENVPQWFGKTETYPSAKPQRCIVTMKPEVTIQTSQYSLAIAEEFKKLSWYCPGKTPTQICKRLREVALEAGEDGIEEGDYTNMDFSCSEDQWEHVLKPIYLRYFSDDTKAELNHLLKEVKKSRAISPHDVTIFLEWAIRSGWSGTSHEGTMQNAFIVFVALYRIYGDYDTAFRKIGAIFGDDSFNANYGRQFSPEVQKVAKELGMGYKSILRKPHEPVQFLGRYFVDPATSDDSFADPVRTIGKLHFSASSRQTVPQAQAAANKAHGYINTDGKTPIIGTWARRVLELTGNLKFKNGTGEERYKCSNSWPQKDGDAIREAMATVMDYSISELLLMDSSIATAPGLDQFPVIMDTEYNHTFQAVVEGEIVGPDPHQTTPVTIAEQAPNNQNESQESNSTANSTAAGGNHSLQQARDTPSAVSGNAPGPNPGSSQQCPNPAAKRGVKGKGVRRNPGTSRKQSRGNNPRSAAPGPKRNTKANPPKTGKPKAGRKVGAPAQVTVGAK